MRWQVQRPERRHFVGSVIFGIGWAIADACPGPIATQLGQGVAWSLFTIVGLVLGIVLFLRRRPEPVDSDERTGAAEALPSPASV